MAETNPKDKSPSREPTEAELKRELIEAVAAAYFGACRKLARLLNRGN
jgi:hypothetical protein